MKTISPSSSYKILVPDNLCSEEDEGVDSFWRENETLLLQLSSSRRTEGVQISASQRLAERIERNPSDWEHVTLPPLLMNGADQAVAEESRDGILWRHYYFVWPRLAIYATISGSAAEVRQFDSWAHEILKTISLTQ